MNDVGAASDLDRLIKAVASKEPQAKPLFTSWLAELTGASPDELAVSLATGGTQQMRNRLGQEAVQHAPQLTLFVLDSLDDVPPCVKYIEDVVAGRVETAKPVGPIAFAAPDSGGVYAIAALVELQPTLGSERIKALFGVAATSIPQTHPELEPVVPETGLWLLMRSGDSEYADLDGIRYHFPLSIPNGRRIAEGDFIVSARTQSSPAADAGQIFGIGRIGRRVDRAEQSDAYAYFDRWLELSTPLDLKEFGDPRTNVNSIVSLPRDWVARLLDRIGVISIDLLPVPFTALTLGKIQKELSRANLFFADDLIHQVLAALRSGKHVMLTGAPGTGKTSLALVIAHAASQAGLAEEPLLTTATADWTSADTVGAYRITKSQTLEFEAGHFVSAVESRRWLVIDELNRADIDKAIGQLFTVLSGQSVVLPFKEQVEEEEASISIVPWGTTVPEGTSPREVGRNWRLIATLNDRDRDLLFDMSEALMRRFAIVEVPAPSPVQWSSILGPQASTGVATWDAALQRLVASAAFNLRPLGAAVVLDCAKHLREVLRLEVEVGAESNRRTAFESAFRLYIAPQLSTSSLEQDTDVASLIEAAWPPSAAPPPRDGSET